MSKPERWAVGFRSAKYTDDPHEVYPVVSVPGGDWRPGTDHEYVRSGEQEQDARLMASAPDLLDALEGLLDPTHQCEACDNSRELNGGCTRWAQVRAAVAQAKGLESEEAWEEWTTSFYAKAQAGGAK